MCPGPSCLPVFVYAGLSPGRLSPPYLSSCISLSILPSHAIFSKSICPAPPGRIHIPLLTPAHFLSLFGTLHFLASRQLTDILGIVVRLDQVHRGGPLLLCSSCGAQHSAGHRHRLFHPTPPCLLCPCRRNELLFLAKPNPASDSS